MTVWLTIALLTVGTFVIKGAGPAALGRHDLPRWALPVIALLPAVLLSALVAYDTFGGAEGFHVDAKLAGVGAALAAVALRAPMIVVLVAAAAVTALTRLVAA
ncbi:AzlD domain-containing protein [Actinomadura fulvescens]|uniref:Branched-chain amino acid transporter AzlD n=1 Tax=Actinomadura fulvescens TaxID=46160 RepID=A0ABN3PHM7_9ACTN